MSDGRAFFKNAIALNISREMALTFVLVEATEAEEAQRAAEAAAHATRACAPRLRAALAQLDALEGIERDILDLHTFDRNARWGGNCEGCDFSGYESEPPDWPCRTVELIADAHDIDLYEFWLYEPKESH